MFEGLFAISLLLVVTCIIGLSRRCARLEARLREVTNSHLDRIEQLELAMPGEQVMNLLYRLDAGPGSGIGPYNTPTGSPFWKRQMVWEWVSDPDANQLKELV